MVARLLDQTDAVQELRASRSDDQEAPVVATSERGATGTSLRYITPNRAQASGQGAATVTLDQVVAAPANELSERQAIHLAGHADERRLRPDQATNGGAQLRAARVVRGDHHRVGGVGVERAQEVGGLLVHAHVGAHGGGSPLDATHERRGELVDENEYLERVDLLAQGWIPMQLRRVCLSHSPLPLPPWAHAPIGPTTEAGGERAKARISCTSGEGRGGSTESS